MSKEIDEFYKQYSARIMELDDTPLFESGTFGTFKMLSVEEYEEMQKQISVLEKQRNNYRHKRNEYRNKVRVLQKQLSDSEDQNVRVLEKLELLVRSNQELEKALELACKVVLDFTGNCPYDQFDLKMPKDCEEECSEQMKRYFCWDKYFIEQAQKELKNE